MNKIQVSQLIIVFTLLSIIFLVALKGTFDGYYGFYYADKKYPKNSIYQINQTICNAYPIKLFCNYTGFDTGYGFFAPNVASDFVVMYRIYDQNNTLIKTKDFVDLTTKEGKIRFSTLYNMFLEKLSKDNSKEYDKYLDIILKQLTRHEKEFYPSNYTITTTLYLYEYPSIENYDKEYCKTQPCQKLIEIKKYQL